MNTFLINLLIAAVAYFLFHALIGALVKDTTAQEIFNVILIIACVFYALFAFR